MDRLLANPSVGRLWDQDIVKVLAVFGAIYLGYVVIGMASGLTVQGIFATLVQLTLLIAIYAMLSLSLNLHWGYTGLFNIGIVGFMAVGAYTMLLVSKPAASVSQAALVGGFGLPFIVGAIAGTVAAALLGLVVALPALRLKADYLAITTIAMAEIIRFTFLSASFQEFQLFGRTVGTGGGRGLLVNFEDPITRYILDTEWFASVAESVSAAMGIEGTIQPALETLVISVVLLGVVAGFYWVFSRTGSSPFGRVLKAIREDETVARALGKNTDLFKIKSFMLGCGLMGLAGVFYAVFFLGSVNPTAFMPRFTFYIWIALIIGGAGSNTGSVMGAALFVGVLFQGPLYLKNAIASVTEITDAPDTIAGGVAALGQLDLAPLFAYTLDNISNFRIIALGLVLVWLMKRRQDGLLGHRKEHAASIPFERRSGDAEEGSDR
jgi:branched-chain amino acid transport system permease protein